jgi:octaprenyl-diphosphate synthase
VTYEELKALVATDMDAVNDRILDKLASDVALINQLGYYIINSGGKRLRPMLLILAARALNYQGQGHTNLAAVIEFIHTATLLHDDVVDESDMRRGNETANALFGNAASVLVGDFLYSRSFQMMIESDSLKVMDVLADTTNRIAEGEVMQLMNMNDPDTTIDSYLNVIEHKTATLFEAAGRLGAILADADPHIETKMAEYGLQLGNAFQMIDDALDYQADEDELGKSLGDDLAEGKPTLPLILALQTTTPENQQIIRAAIEQGDRDQFATIKAIIDETGSLQRTIDLARQEAAGAKNALNDLPDSEYKDALAMLADMAVERSA